MEKYVICNRAGTYKSCGDCPHSIPHEKWEDVLDGVCTQWGECLINSIIEDREIKVRCIKVKQKDVKSTGENNAQK